MRFGGVILSSHLLELLDYIAFRWVKGLGFRVCVGGFPRGFRLRRSVEA